jgi:hypothetical protein
MAERWILATLRHQTFFSGVALNDAIRERLQRLNDRLGSAESSGPTSG